MIDLERKVGPLPLWAWGALAVGGLFLVHRYTAGVGIGAEAAVGPSALGPGPYADHQRDTSRDDIGGGGGGGGEEGPLFAYRGGLVAPALSLGTIDEPAAPTAVGVGSYADRGSGGYGHNRTESSPVQRTGNDPRTGGGGGR